MTMIEKVINPWLVNVKAYPASPESSYIRQMIKLDANESRFGISPKVKAAIANGIESAYLYPDATADHFKKTLSNMLWVDKAQITLGNGSNDVLDLITRAFCQQGDEIMFSQYAFAAYPLLAKISGAKPVMVKANGWQHDLKAMYQSITDKTKLIFVANPNNPTGTVVGKSNLLQFLDLLPKDIILVLDEAYFEYSETVQLIDSVRLLNSYPNLILVRTFSKAYGLAGFRVGYSVSHPEVAEVLNRVRQPFNLNRLGLIAASEAMREREFLKQTVAKNHLGYQQLSLGLAELDLNYIESETNFICVEVGLATKVTQQLKNQNILVADLTGYQMPEYIRVTIGSEADNTAFLKALGNCIIKLNLTKESSLLV
ncbi:histidinol-phosphate transaminase [Catenovulum maritimum]|nr:histidinol-phosphate transaminase [Catenovulum maritimum]